VLSRDENDTVKFARLRKNWLLIRSMLALHPREFSLAFLGAAVFALGTVASSFAIRWVIDNVILERFESGDVSGATVATGLGLVIGIGLVRAVGVVFRRAAASAGMWRVAETYTNQVLGRLVEQPVGWHRRHADGDLVARGGVDTETTVSVIAPIPFATSTVLMIFISTIWLFVIDIPLGVVALVVFPLVVMTNVVYERSVSVHYTTAQGQLGEFSAAVHESFEGVQLVKSYGAEARETERLAELADRVRASRVEAIRLRTWFEALQDVIPAVTNIGLVLLGAVRVRSGDVTVGEFTSVIFLFTLLVLPLRLIGYALSELPRSMAAWLRIQEVTTEPIEPDPSLDLGIAPEGVGVRFDHVTFAHRNDLAPALVDVDLDIPAGTIAAIVGPTGAGKSTMADLALGIVAPQQGQVSLAPGSRSIVFQEAFLLAGTVRDNIVLGHDFTDDEIWAALEIAAAAEFVAALPQRLETVVGERGVSLSGGQRQRVALARALIRRPSLLILDDTTSALDPATEATVLERLRSSLSEATVLLVASRPSTIALADEVVFVEAGRVSAHGVHADLMASSPSYRRLVEAFESDRAGAA
jgi:ATP-binding cassette, subfamily B, bacterial